MCVCLDSPRITLNIAEYPLPQILGTYNWLVYNRRPTGLAIVSTEKNNPD